MGYADLRQTTAGIHTRTYARAFIFEDADIESPKRNVFVSIDIGMLGFMIKDSVIEALDAIEGMEGIYTHQNVALSPTHTHSAPGGYMQNFLFLVTSWGFVQEPYFQS